MKLNDEEKKAIKEAKHFANLSRYWRTEEYEEEEITEYIKIILNLIEKQKREIRDNYFLYIKEKDNYDKLLVLYEKQRKEIEELKEQNQNFIVNIALEIYKNTTKNLNDLELLNEGWKKKIQDKIDELNKQIEELKKNAFSKGLDEVEFDFWKSELNKAIAKRNVLQELLESEE